MPRTSALFDYIVGQQNADTARLQQQAEAQKLEQKDNADNERDFWSKQLAGDFDRRLKLVELQAKMAGAMGQPAPQPEDSQLRESVMPNYMAGQYDRSKLDDTKNLKLGQLQQQLTLQQMLEKGRNSRADENLDMRALLAQQAGQQRTSSLEEQRRYHDLLAMLAGQRVNDQQDAKQDVRMQKLQQSMKDAPDINDLRLVASALDKQDIPGQGRFWDAPLTQMGFGSDEDNQMSQATQRLHNAYLHMVSGAAVTPSEADRSAIATGLSPWATDSQRREGIKALLRNVHQGMQNIQTQARPEDVQLRQQRGGVTAGDVPLPPSAAPGGGSAQTGKVKVQKPDGTIGYIPAEKVEAFLHAYGPGAQVL